MNRKPLQSSNGWDADLFCWEALGADTVGAPLDCIDKAAPSIEVQSVQFAGEFSGASVICEGSNDGTEWCPLSDPLGIPIETGSAKLFGLLERPLLLRPVVSGGSPNTSIRVTIFARRPR